jgi:hypothetical protein
MAYNQGGAISLQCLFENFPNSHHRGIERADIDRADRLNSILGVEQHGAQMFLIQVTHLQHQQVGDISRTLDLPAGQSIAACDARSKFDCSLKLGGAADADAGDELLQLDRAECLKTTQPASRDQQPLSGLQARHTSDDGQKFSIGQSCRALMREAVTRLVGGEELADGEWVGFRQREKRGLERGDVVRGVVVGELIANLHGWFSLRDRACRCHKGSPPQVKAEERSVP